MFGELLGLLIAQVWMDQGAPSPFTLAELGPGRGTLMADILRATARVPGFQAGAQVHLVEASPSCAPPKPGACPALFGMTRQIACPTTARFSFSPTSFSSALPIRQFLRHPKRLGRTRGGAGGFDKLVFGLTPPAPLAALDDLLDQTPEGAMVETCAPALPVIDAISTRIAAQGGFALIVDYGDWGSTGDTLQAIWQQQKDAPPWPFRERPI